MLDDASRSARTSGDEKKKGVRTRKLGDIREFDSHRGSSKERVYINFGTPNPWVSHSAARDEEMYFFKARNERRRVYANSLENWKEWKKQQQREFAAGETDERGCPNQLM